MAKEPVPVRGGVGPEDYEDPPLDNVVRDNIDVDIYAGPSGAFTTKNGEVHPSNIGTGRDSARPYDITDMEIVLTDDQRSNYVMADVVGDGHNIPPYPGDLPEDDPGSDIVTIDVDNDLMEVRDDTEGEITRLFTGVISNSSRIIHGRFEFMAFWPGFNEIQEGSIDLTPPTPVIHALQRGAFGRDTDYTPRRTTTGRVAEKIGEKLTDGRIFEYSLNIGYHQVGEIDAAVDTEITFSTSADDVPITTKDSEGALTRMIEASNAVWDIDRYGRFVVGPPDPDGDGPSAVNSHKLRYITETDAGRRSPVWQSIKVVGDGVVSQDGWNKSALIHANPAVLAADAGGTENVDAAIARSDTLQEPTFVYRNMEINTTEEAKHVLDKLRDELKKQSAGGHVTVVGHVEVWPGDAVELPDSVDQPYNNEKFVVNKVTHRLNNSDGFITRIEVGGQTNAVQSAYVGKDQQFDFLREYSGYSRQQLHNIKRKKRNAGARRAPRPLPARGGPGRR